MVNKCSSAQNFKHCGFTLVRREVMMKKSPVNGCFTPQKNIYLFEKLLNLTKIVDFDDKMNISEWIHGREIRGKATFSIDDVTGAFAERPSGVSRPSAICLSRILCHCSGPVSAEGSGSSRILC